MKKCLVAVSGLHASQDRSGKCYCFADWFSDRDHSMQKLGSLDLVSLEQVRQYGGHDKWPTSISGE
jgi:hypothetical protein